jgi:4,5-DOPA dioxygenase extradiol
MSDVGRIKGGILLTNLMPAIFIGHGNPMNALSENNYTEGWASIGKSIPRPRAILSVSAHYYIPYLCTWTSQGNGKSKLSGTRG